MISYNLAQEFGIFDVTVGNVPHMYYMYTTHVIIKV